MSSVDSNCPIFTEFDAWFLSRVEFWLEGILLTTCAVLGILGNIVACIIITRYAYCKIFWGNFFGCGIEIFEKEKFQIMCHMMGCNDSSGWQRGGGGLCSTYIGHLPSLPDESLTPIK